MTLCAASASTGVPQQWTQCDNEAEVWRYVLLRGYLVSIALCDPHRELWDMDFRHIAIHGGAPVTESTITSG